MTYDFDEPIERRGTNSAKWDSGPMLIKSGMALRYDADTISLFTADMDFRCPPCVKEEIQKTVDENLYGYTSVSPFFSDKRYYEAIAGWYKRRHGAIIDPKEIIAMEGTVNSVKQAILAFSKEGDGVIINRPIYGPFTKAILSSGRKVVNSQLIDNEGYYTIDFDDFEEKAALPDTSCFILCNPHNPTGRIWSDEELMRLYDICLKNHVLMIADEIHGDLIRKDKVFHPMLTLCDGRNLITCTAANKTFNVAGLKASYVIIKEDTLRRRYQKTIGLVLVSPVAISAVIGAYNGGEEWLEELKGYLDKTFDYVMDFCKKNLPRMKCRRPEGTYVLWMDFRGYGLSAEEIKRKIYYDADLILESGRQFDPDLGDGFERACLSTRLSLVQEAFKRIAKQFENV